MAEHDLANEKVGEPFILTPLRPFTVWKLFHFLKFFFPLLLYVQVAAAEEKIYLFKL